MEEIIKITENKGQKAVSARELHKFLEIETPFRKWIVRMFEYGFAENEDFGRVDIFVRGQKINDYALSMDCAKHIAMIQRNEKGKKARRYFIEIEKEYKTLAKPREVNIWSGKARLVEFLSENLIKGDVRKVAQETGYSENHTSSVKTGAKWNGDIMASLVDRGVYNIRTGGETLSKQREIMAGLIEKIDKAQKFVD